MSKGKKVLNLEGLVTYFDPNGRWCAKAINFNEGMDVSDYEILGIKAKGKQGRERIRIQLVNDFKEVNKSKGLWPKLELAPIELSKDSKNIEIPLLKFKRLGVDLKKICRLAIHYGKEAWGKKLNDTNTNEIIIEEIVFE